MLPLKYRTWILKKRLPTVVNFTPSEITGNEKSIRFTEINAERIIINSSTPRFFPIIYMLGGIIGVKLFLDSARIDIIVIILSLVCSILATTALFWFLFYKKKQVIFDRMNCTVSIPGPLWYKNIEIPFKEVVAVIRTETYYYAQLNVLNLYRPDGYKANVGINTQSLETLHNDWAFYVWYMDKDKPLPPAPVFETHRQPSASEYVAGEASSS